MDRAIALAKEAFKADEVPVGAVIIHHPTGRILAEAHNETEQKRDCTAHAEMLAIRQAQAALGDKSLAECDIWVTLEPCAMCAAALAHARIRRIYYGAGDEKGGAIDHGAHIFNLPTTHHKPDIYGGIAEAESADLLRRFFQSKRKDTKQDPHAL